MYARRLRCSSARSLPRQRAHRLAFRRCLATVEPAPAPASNDVDAPPRTFVDMAKSSDSWLGPVSSSASDASPSRLQDKAALDALAGLVREHHQKRTSQNVDAVEQNKTMSFASRSICVIPEQRLLNMPGILTLLRELERRFGRMREFLIVRDKDSISDYMKAVFVRFQEEDSLQRIQDALRGKDRGTIMVSAAPEWNNSKSLDGGVGLQDVQALLRPQTERIGTVEEIEADKEIESAVNNAEKALQDAETGASGPDSSDAIPVPSPISIDTCECRIEIQKNGFQSSPYLHERDYYMRVDNRRAHVARSFIHWAGFYPHYRFAEYNTDDTSIRNGKETEDDAQMSREKERAEIIRSATREMRDAIIYYRRFLRRIRDPNHGLEIRNGKDIVVDWEAPSKSQSSQGPTTDESSEESSGSAKGKWEKPKVLTPEDEEFFGHLSARSNLAQVQTDKRTVATSKPAKKKKKTSSRATAESAPPSPSPSIATSYSPQLQSEDTPTGTSETKAGSVLPEILHSPLIAPSTPAARDSPEAKERQAGTNGIEGKRKEVEERASFKAKLLGWLSR